MTLTYQYPKNQSYAALIRNKC